MYLKKIHIDNYRLLIDVDIVLDQSLTLFVGKNNTGKTSVMQLIKAVLSGTKTIPFDDYPLVCRHKFYELLFKLWDGEIDITDFTNDIPRTRILFEVDYSSCGQDEPLGALGQFVIDIDDNQSSAVIEAVYEPSLTESTYNNIKERYEAIKNSDNTLDDEDVVGRAVKENFDTIFSLCIAAKNPSNEDCQDRTIKDLQGVFVFKEISAERSLDESEDSNDKPLAKIMNNLFNPELEILEEDLKENVDNLNKLIDAFNTSAQTQVDGIMGKIVQSMIDFGYPSAEDLQLHASTKISLKNQILNNTDLTYVNKNQSEALPSTHNGLGYKNLIKISLLLQEFAKDVKGNLSAIPLLYIEEPEAHMHPQLQTMFVSYVTKYLKTTLEGKDIQVLLTTHSSHVANTVPFSQIRYMRRKTESVECKNITDFYNKAFNGRQSGEKEQHKKNLEFLQKYMKLSYCDLYFCDKAILVEGAAERLLLPNMIEKCNTEGLFVSKPSLASQYYSIIEVGGAYALNFFEFVDFLEIPTLIITDVDYVGGNQKKCQKKDAVRSSNATISRWCRDMYDIAVSNPIGIDKVIELCGDAGKKTNGLRHIEFQGLENKAYPRSLEEAIINVNRDIFGVDLSDTEIDYDENEIGKTDFAIRLLVEPKYSVYKVPGYIKDGLKWLDAQSKMPESIEPVTKLKRKLKGE